MPKLSTQLQSKSRQGTKFPTTTYAYTLSCPKHQKPGILGYTLKLLKIPENSRVSRIFSESALEFCVLIHTLIGDRLMGLFALGLLPGLNAKYFALLSSH